MLWQVRRTSFPVQSCLLTAAFKVERRGGVWVGGSASSWLPILEQVSPVNEKNADSVKVKPVWTELLLASI